MRPIKSARYTTYQGHQVRVNDGETTPQAISRYRQQIAQEEADRLESERLAKEEKLAAKELRRKTPKYTDGTIVLTKDGEYFQVYEGYYSEYDNDIAYEAVPCTETGKWVTPRNDWEDLTIEIYQKDIQRKVPVKASSRTFTKYPSNYIKSVTEADREFKAVPLKSLKKGAWFTVKPIAEPTDKQVYIKDDYDREEKKFMCGRCDDISYSTYFKGDKLVYDDSNFEY